MFVSILSKPGPLDENEWRVMRTHPQVGYDLLRNQPRFADAAEMVLAHHEAYDGSGYPRRLESTRIPKAARVLAVADAYDSMTHPHTQRPAGEIALSINLGFDAPHIWPFYLGTRHGVQAVSLSPGDGVLYLARDVPHWRGEFDGEHHVQAFFHYVDRRGPNAEWKYDKRRMQPVEV